MVNKGGRPPMYSCVEDLQEKIEGYIQDCPDKRMMLFKVKDKVIEKEMPCPTITGLALHLGFCDRRSFYEYEEKDKFTHTIKKARAFIEKHYEQLLQAGNPTGAIFALKNFGWKDTPLVDQSTNITNVSIHEVAKEYEKNGFEDRAKTSLLVD